MDVEKEVSIINNTLPDNVEKLKLFKNTKGYNWEIQLIGIDIKRLIEVNAEMEKQFGSQL